MAIDEKKLIEVLKQRIAAHEKDAAEIGSYAIGCNGEELLLRLADEVQAIIEVVEAQPKVNEWIPCSERLPEKPEFGEDSYLVQSKIVKTPYTAYWDGEKWSNVLDEKIFDVIAWMPLPPTCKPK